MRFTPLHRLLLYLAFAGVALSGLAWSTLDLAYGLGPSAVEAVQLAKAWLAKTHGGLSLLGLLAFGTTLTIHVPFGWKGDARRGTGIALLVATLLLLITGYLLYYAAGDALREWSAWLHIAIGVAICALFAAHLLGRKTVLDDGD